ncbi:Ethanolamine ammonia-lyase light chain [bioreactor metagenome]|uniref:Ethanolamine ammonia-lyase light chain n=1 Tax=bioreactor metagenome TaxID=1076179 RepID=A0A645ECM2_9ZZZZ
MDEKTLEQIVNLVINELKSNDVIAKTVPSAHDVTNDINEIEKVPDITSADVKQIPLLENAKDSDSLSRMMKKTSARIGVGRAGPRVKTQTLLALRADHAAARDAVFMDVDENLIKSLNLFSVKTKCKDRTEFLTRPDLGRQFSDESIRMLKEKCEKNIDVQIFVADGLSSKAIEANIANILSALTDGLKAHGLSIGTPFFVQYGRVASMDYVADILSCKVTCVLIGERPGLGSAESMSAYIAYDAKIGMPESNRTVVSNIYSGGINAVEAGAYIADVIKNIYDHQASGVNLKK